MNLFRDIIRKNAKHPVFSCWGKRRNLKRLIENTDNWQAETISDETSVEGFIQSNQVDVMILLSSGLDEDFEQEIKVNPIVIEKNIAASDLKDAGIDSPTALVAAGNVTKGIINEYKIQNGLKADRLEQFKLLGQVYLLAGPAFFEVAGGGISEALSAYKK